MNTPNPLVPQGSLLEQKSKSKSNLVIAVFTVLAIHVVLFTGLLMQGCGREKAGANAKTNTFALDTNLFPNTNVPAIPSTNYYTETPSNPPMITNITSTTMEIPGAAKEYKVVKDDSFYKIAKNHGVTLTALAKANPNVDSRKLKIGQIIQIPPATNVTATTPGKTETQVTEAGQNLYTVKGGDNLTKIAKEHGTTVKALRELNGLKSDRLKVSQKLKLPAPKTGASPQDTTPSGVTNLPSASGKI